MIEQEHRRIRYVVIGSKRSGTTVTHLCLSGHPNVAAVHDEVKVSPLFTRGMEMFTISGGAFLSPKEREGHHSALFNAITGLEADATTMAQGLKLTLRSPREAADLVGSLQAHFPDVTVIQVVRDDLVAQYGSGYRVQMTGQAHSWRKSDTDKDVSFAIPKSRFIQYARSCLAVLIELERLKETHRVITVNYENDILPNKYDTYYEIFRELGLPKVEITWLKSEKVARPPDQYITNYAELRQVLADLRSKPCRADNSPEWLKTVRHQVGRWQSRVTRILAILRE